MIPLERLTDGSPVARNFDLLARLVPDTGGVSLGIHVGAVNATWPGGSTDSGDIVVTHGFDHSPAYINLIVTNQASVGSHAVWSLFPLSATQWQFRIKTFSATPANTVVTPCAWMAIG